MPKKKISATLTVLAVLFSVGAAMAAPDQMREIYGDWNVRCVVREELPPCDMVQFARNNDNGEQVMQFSLAYAGARDSYGVQFLLPLGIHIQGGVLVRLDDTTDLTDFVITRCEVVGCFIERLMTEAELQSFRVSSTGLLAVIGRDGGALVVPLSLNGFAEALEVMTGRNRDWADN